MSVFYENRYYALSLENEGLRYVPAGGEPVVLTWPAFELDGQTTGAPEGMAKAGEEALSPRITALTARGKLACGASLTLEARVSPHTPIFRFRYVLSSDAPAALTKKAGENLSYFVAKAPAGGAGERTEVRLSGYDSLTHGYSLSELQAFLYEEEVMGPIVTEQRGGQCALYAYEHGSMYPDKFVAFVREGADLRLKALRGNYYAGEEIGGGRAYDTIWLQLGAVAGTRDDMARAYRDFVLSDLSLNTESRKPYIFYNTWCYQERNRFRAPTTYLASMKQQRMLDEIEVAHRMGVDVFVIDTGWYQKTGDWETNRAFFPDGMEAIHAKLEAYGMKLGLWFNPIVAAKTSRLLQAHRGMMASTHGREPKSFPIWETEESYRMCLVSDYWEAFADELIRLADTVGVRYFKWDAIDMYGCDCAGHDHGGEGNAPDERHDCFAFNVVRYMSKVIDKLCRAHPDAIVDFDVTEAGRCFGLAFLSSGKYFFTNNGPYYENYDIPCPEDKWNNIFVYPGPARTWVCRQSLGYDRWIPSVLMMTHYLPDDPASSQLINLASLILGQNGFWGDLPAISDEGVSLIRRVLDVYKRVRDDITRACPFVVGKPGEIFEAHEKLDGGRGAVALFGNRSGEIRYRLHGAAAQKATVFGPAEVTREGGDTWITVNFPEPGAAIVFFE